jgi:subfamily B ATP-binding cassette protein MsbA
MSYCGVKVLEQLRYELFAKIICLPLDFFGETRVGMLMSRIISDVNLISSSLPELIRMAQHVLTMIGLTGLIVYRDPKLAFWACLVFPLAVYPVIYFGKKLRKNGRKMQAKVASGSRARSTTCCHRPSWNSSGPLGRDSSSGMAAVKSSQATEPLGSSFPS